MIIYVMIKEYLYSKHWINKVYLFNWTIEILLSLISFIKEQLINKIQSLKKLEKYFK